MKRILAVSLTLVFALFALSCQKIVDDTTASVKDDITYQNSPNYEGSTWSGTGDETVMYKVVRSEDSKGNVTRTSTPIKIKVASVSLTLGADKTFTLTETLSFTAEIENNYITDNYKYSTSTANLLVPTALASRTDYEEDGADVFVAQGVYDYIWNLSSSMYTIGTTATTYNNTTVYPVTYKTVTPGSLSGKTIQKITYTGNWETLNTTDPVNNTTSVRLFILSRTNTTYNHYASPVTVVSQNNVYELGDSRMDWRPTKGLNAEGKDTFYVYYDSSFASDYKVYIN